MFIKKTIEACVKNFKIPLLNQEKLIVQKLKICIREMLNKNQNTDTFSVEGSIVDTEYWGLYIKDLFNTDTIPFAEESIHIKHSEFSGDARYKFI